MIEVISDPNISRFLWFSFILVLGKILLNISPLLHTAQAVHCVIFTHVTDCKRNVYIFSAFMTSLLLLLLGIITLFSCCVERQ